MIIDKIQNQLEYLYNVGISQRVENYLINQDEARQLLSNNSQKIPKELLFVRKTEDDIIELALFLDNNLLGNLSKNNPFVELNENNFSDFCILIEGISHFVYYLWKAYKQLPITKLEMELQAEIDKFLMLFLFLRSDQQTNTPTKLFETLFENYQLIEQLSFDEKDRYNTASSLAGKYCYNLQNKFGSTQNIEGLIQEARFFYNLSQEQKIHHIMQ